VALLLAVLLTVSLASPFGDAEARAVSIRPFTVELSVRVDTPASAVLVRAVGIGGELDPVALVDHGDGTWAGLLELTRVEDVSIVFEAIAPDGTSTLSDPATLRDLGVDPVVFDAGASGSGPVPARRAGSTAGRWLAIAVLAALGALVLLGIWSIRREASTGADGGERDGAGDLPPAG